MRITLKKILVLCLLFLNINSCANFCLAAGTIQVQLGSDYLITTGKSVKTSLVTNPELVSLTPFFTIFNEKNVLLLHPKKAGQTYITIFLKDGDASFNVIVKSDKNSHEFDNQQIGDFEIMLFDAPPSMKAVSPAIKSGGR